MVQKDTCTPMFIAALSTLVIPFYSFLEPPTSPTLTLNNCSGCWNPPFQRERAVPILGVGISSSVVVSTHLL